jgi:hypothetical protein
MLTHANKCEQMLTVQIRIPRIYWIYSANAQWYVEVLKLESVVCDHKPAPRLPAKPVPVQAVYVPLVSSLPLH